ncbi:hypothetical protein BH11VER1_BH11VER1_17680 [soil metagenome]
MKTPLAAVIALILVAGFFPACKKEAPTPKGKVKTPKVAVQEVNVEIRPDGLAYLPGSAGPFTGDALEIHADRTPPTLAKRTPYTNGKKNGAVTTYSPGGRKREERRYDNGLPVSSDVFYSNGQHKIEVLLNAKDLAQGPYKRWHDNGVLEAEATFDENEFFHGIEKDYDREGNLVGHYRKEHGILLEVIFETPEMKKIRFDKGYLLPSEKVEK